MLPQAFQEFFSEVYKDRWPTILSSLQQSEVQVARRSSWAAELSDQEVREWKSRDGRLFDCQSVKFEKEIDRNDQGLLQDYIMDPASILAARSLPIQSTDRVLDMCAAPGGKTLILLQQLGEAAELISNDLSADRRERLKKVIQQYVPREVRDRVWIKGQDAVNYGLKEKDSFDAVLLDAPCSGERHLLENAKALAEWSKRRSENLATRQYSLLCSALLAVKSKGYILYSTCSISPLENDGVIRKLLKKKSDEVEVVICQDSEILERTEFGQMALPDRFGFGPIYFCLLRKL